jgi:hypothetical protein
VQGVGVDEINPSAADNVIKPAGRDRDEQTPTAAGEDATPSEPVGTDDDGWVPQ